MAGGYLVEIEDSIPYNNAIDDSMWGVMEYSTDYSANTIEARVPT